MAAPIAIRRTPYAHVSLGFCLLLRLASPLPSIAADDEALKSDAEVYFRDRVTPFIKSYCLRCHRSEQRTQTLEVHGLLVRRSPAVLDQLGLNVARRRSVRCPCTR